ncbi:Tat pathway signal sequence domain protein [Brevundimonas sp. AJA228-03]|uniref:Tat pathway signal sequence domain protein n=1 Tax=Brevundimonas sp. AJA228-03 TaxID=2752515 RepID=UPI001ADEF4C0|nr:Tat pathway signal sequence domain protein [Brevundimonas sp. AJA228-03]QTN19087.1 Tat pathway signal sequence domain protein [Brevundimonas sp. AJA228-03]
MRLATVALAALAVLASAGAASAQSSQSQRDRQGQQQGREDEDEARPPRIAPLRARPNAGPCPFVKVLYDAARYVELDGGRAAASAVGYTGEIQGVTAGCRYLNDDPIEVQMNILFDLGRGPMAQGDQRTYRYWIAVTERNEAVLAKEYFDLPVNFDGSSTTSVTEAQSVVIPRASATTSGGNFEILVGFEVTPEMAEFNRSGSRFRINAGTTAATPPAP